MSRCSALRKVHLSSGLACKPLQSSVTEHVEISALLVPFSYDNKLYAINPDGTEKWNFPTAGMSIGSPAFGPSGTIYVGVEGLSFYAINPDGTLKWEYPVNEPVYGPAAVGAGGNVYFGARDGKVYGLDPDGNKIWEFATGDIVAMSPAIAADGLLYIISSNDGKLYALTGGNYVDPASGNPGNALVLDWSTCMELDLNHLSFGGADNFTISMWYKGGAQLYKQSGGTTHVMDIWWTNGGFGFGENGVAWHIPLQSYDSPINTSFWNHAALTKAGNTYSVYVNGRLDKQFNEPSLYNNAEGYRQPGHRRGSSLLHGP